MSIITDLIGLKEHLDHACTAALSAAAPHTLTRPATVVNREIINFYQGLPPLVEVFWVDRQAVRIAGSRYGPTGQTYKNPSIYVVRISSAVNPDTSPAFTVDDAQTELMVIAEAIEVWWSVVPHRCLPDSGAGARVQDSGPPFRWRANPQGPYAVTNSQLQPIAVGSITVIGFPRESTTS